jgi:hypothetical protein
MGYTFINRHLNFLLLISLYSVGTMVILSSFLGYEVFILGLFLVILDISFIFLIDKKLTLESFSKIMKGGY